MGFLLLIPLSLIRASHVPNCERGHTVRLTRLETEGAPGAEFRSGG